MPFIVAHSVVSFLRRRAYTKKHGDRAAEQRDECAPLHSITSSARSRTASGILSPSALAVVRLMTKSNLVGCSTGMSAGFAPRRILSTRSAARRNKSGKFAPQDIRPPTSTNSRKLCIVGSRSTSDKVLRRTRRVDPTLESRERGREILGSPDFERGDVEAEGLGRCLNLAHLQDGGGRAGIDHNGQSAQTGHNLAQQSESLASKIG